MTLLWTLALATTAVAACTDLRTGHIPNWLTASAFALGLIVHGAAAGATGGAQGAGIAVAWSLGGALVCAAPALMLFARGAMGGGDVKLFAALGALIHPVEGLQVEVYAFVVAALVALGQIVYRGALLETLARSSRLLVRTLRLLPRRVALPEAEEAAALPPHLLGWLRLGPSIFVGAAITWVLRHS